MGKLFADISMSLDGYIAGPDDNMEHPLGKGGDRLHHWVYNLASWREQHGMTGGETGTDSDILTESFQNTRAVLMGRRMFDLAEEPWGDTPPFRMPVFVLTHRPRETLVKSGGTTFTFVTDGLASALEQARAAAGDHDIAVGGGADIIQQCLRAGVLDEIQVHVVPVLLGAGRRLFDQTGPNPLELEPTRVIGSPEVTHIRYRLVKE